MTRMHVHTSLDSYFPAGTKTEQFYCYTLYFRLKIYQADANV